MIRYIRYLLSALLVPVTIECAVRVDDLISYGAPFLQNFNQDSLYEFDELGQRGKPNARYLKWQLNNLGFRGPDLVEDSERIGVVGSSETFGLYEGPDHEWPREVEKCANSGASHTNTQVVNFAFPGMLLSTFERRLPEFLDKTKPGRVIIYPSFVGYFYRDLTDPFGNKPPAPQGAHRFELRLMSRAQEVIKKLMPSFVQDYLRKRQLAKAANATAKVYDVVPEEYLEIFHQDLVRVIEKLRSRSVEPILVTHATYFGDRVEAGDMGMLVAWRKFYPMLKEDGFLDLENKFNAVLKEEARKKNIKLVDLASEIPRGPDFFADFTHFTDKGAEFAGKKICEGVKR